MMLRTHPRPARQALALGLVGALLAAPGPALAKPARPAKTKKATPAPAPAPAESDAPDAGDGNIADEPLEPGQLGPATGVSRQRSATGPTSVRSPRRSSVQEGLELSDRGDQAFDSGDYQSAARFYSKALELLSENGSNHMTRSVVLANLVTAQEQLYAGDGELDHLRTAQRHIQEYLRACKAKHGVGCDRFAETQEARTRLTQVSARIDEAAPVRKKIPPEIGAAPGGKAYDLTLDQPAAPAWIGPAIVGGVLLAGGGSALIYYAATADKYGPIVRREGETLDTDGTDGTDTDGTGTSTGTGVGIEITPELRGKLLIGIGAFLAAAGVGFAVLGSMRLAKHRRLNRQRAQSLAVTPAFNRGGAGLALSGRF